MGLIKTDLSKMLGETSAPIASSSDLSALLQDVAEISTVNSAALPPVAGAAATGGVAYDGSSKLDRLSMWRPALRSADADLLPEKSSLDARVKDTLRNDAYVAGGSNLRKDHIVGAQYRLNSKPETAILFGKEDSKWEEEFQEEVETKFTLVAESEQNWFDISRRNTLTDLVRLAVGVHLSGGEVLSVSQWAADDGRPYRTSVQMIDSDRLSTPLNKMLLPNRRIRNGVERNRNGEHIAYYIRNSHPNEGVFGDYNQLGYANWTRVPSRTSWGRLRVLYLYEQLRPDQSRGVSELVTALTESRMTKHFRKTELERAVISATYAASIESEFPDDILNAMGGNFSGEGNASMQWMSDYLAALNEYSSGARNLHMDGAKIPVFAPGTHLKIQNPGATGPLGDKYEQSLLRYIAASLGVSYEQLSRDFTQTNYSSARAAFGETWKSMQSLKRSIADRFATFIYRLWLEEAINKNDIEALKRRNVPNYYDGLNADAYSACEWIGAGQGQIDPLKETQASLLKVKAGFSTKEIEIAKMSGGDWRKTARQIKRERDLDSYYENPSIYDTADTTDLQNSLTASPNDGEK